MRAKRHVDPDALRQAAVAEPVADFLVCNRALEDLQTNMDIHMLERSECLFACECGLATVIGGMTSSGVELVDICSRRLDEYIVLGRSSLSLLASKNMTFTQSECRFWTPNEHLSQSNTIASHHMVASSSNSSHLFSHTSLPGVNYCQFELVPRFSRP